MKKLKLARPKISTIIRKTVAVKISAHAQKSFSFATSVSKFTSLIITMLYK